jgi:hypothetical protein
MLAGLHVPAIPSFDVGGSNGAVECWQSGPIASNVGDRLLTIVTFIEVTVAQLPAEGVNVYVADPSRDVLIPAGLHVPVIPSEDVDGRAGAVAFWQYEVAMVGKVGEILPTIVMFKVTGITQLPADDGVNVYVVVPRAEVLILTGLHVPAIPSFDVGGRDGGVEFWQSGPIGSNMGEKLLTTEMLKETGAAQLPADGVNM